MCKTMAEHDYSPGEAVPRTGIYRVKHNGHRSEHDATLLEGTEFPACAHCGCDVRFQLIRSAVPIHRDRDFEGDK